MHKRIIVLVFAALAVLATPVASLAQTVAETASKWGLLGAWRLDCSKSPSRSDQDIVYVAREGKLFYDRDYGDGKDSSPVMSATTKPDGSIEIVTNFASISQTRQFSMIKRSDGLIRAISNRNIDTDEYSVKDGKFTATGNDTPWQTRCR